jgi:hypothetical protein
VKSRAENQKLKRTQKGQKNMTEDQRKMTIILKSRIRENMAELVLQEVLLACYNSYVFEAGTVKSTAIFDPADIQYVHKFSEREYTKDLRVFFSTEEKERNKIVNAYITKITRESNNGK